ncbi:calcium and integrin-binding family member 3-like [Leptopilina heterotoma]|uniref:calcium and integrin-binding family member 3-like n=1 Tax=Leptopilina heterotoma TaxID=63436 RepID=UPI001CA90536|nr:calcium and integrin-binding family member 3-like [Leptopilina heterotoma]
MGNKVYTFTEEQLEDYQDSTYFTRKEILRIYQRFRDIGGSSTVPEILTPLEASSLRIPFSTLDKIPELKENPFRDRILEVFTTHHHGHEPGNSSNEGICFEDFLEMMSVFSDQAPRDLKVHYAFKIYDFDGDGLLGLSDLEKTCNQLVRGGLSPEEVATICEKVLEESDIDSDGALSFLEFENVVTRSTDFLSTFQLRI